MNLIFMIAVIRYIDVAHAKRINRCGNTYKIIVILIQFLLFIEPIIETYTIYVKQSNTRPREKREKESCEKLT